MLSVQISNINSHPTQYKKQQGKQPILKQFFSLSLQTPFHLPVPGSSSPEEHHKDTIHSRTAQFRNDEKTPIFYLLFFFNSLLISPPLKCSSSPCIIDDIASIKLYSSSTIISPVNFV